MSGFLTGVFGPLLPAASTALLAGLIVLGVAREECVADFQRRCGAERWGIVTLLDLYLGFLIVVTCGLWCWRGGEERAVDRGDAGAGEFRDGGVCVVADATGEDGA